MRIIENNFKENKQEYEITCPHCKSKLAYTFDDVISDGFGYEWIHCDACDKQIKIWDDGIPKVDDVSYPKDFQSYGKASKVNDATINEWIKEVVNDLDKGIDYSFRASGDTIVFAYKSDEDSSAATVTVAKGYSEIDVKIPKEKF